jgi:hypothetical protein
MTLPATLKWIGLALLGVAIAAAIAVAASNLASRQIGLASEPISAGDALAPAAKPKASQGSKHAGGPQAPPTSSPTAPELEPAPEATTPPTETQPPREAPSQEGDDSHGGGGGGHGADD